MNKLPTPYYQDEWATIYCGDCKDILPLLEPVDLVLTDPPYGIGENSFRVKSRGKLAKTRDYGSFDWDKKPIDKKLIDLCISKGKYTCMFEGNYYEVKPSKCWLIWDKLNGKNNYADCELAWTNYPSAVRIKKHLWNGMIRKDNEIRYHPTQKPVEVMIWCISLSPIADTILDPMFGSGTTLVAAKQLGRKSIGIEISEKYCRICVERLKQEYLPLEPLKTPSESTQVAQNLPFSAI